MPQVIPDARGSGVKTAIGGVMSLTCSALVFTLACKYMGVLLNEVPTVTGMR